MNKNRLFPDYLRSADKLYEEFLFAEINFILVERSLIYDTLKKNGSLHLKFKIELDNYKNIESIINKLNYLGLFEDVIEWDILCSIHKNKTPFILFLVQLKI